MEEKVIEALIELKSETQAIRDSYTLTDWKNKATNVIIRIYGHDSPPEKQIENLRYLPGFSGGSNVNERKKQASQLIDGLIKEIERFGLPSQLKKEKEGLHINITQTSNQQTKINLSLIIEIIQDELKGAQLKALQEIIEDKEVEAEEKKVRIIEKLKSFGSDIASNIVASILTNPALFG
ncbi:hypothetical protein [Algoriphagus sp. NG3]|uniref:hypothetical protein n=1 Tax=Algoriphagus sp. NG3 TaxID=3097546 RepID=UPI002A8366F4|nr:hypothetical protein [Algoriphagus sp. NG3]WPR75218.1 hypothetical protein SLW71_21385 [Algoriphagus sp. NG3]